MFLAALSLSFISKALSAVLMKSSLTQIERRFDISSSTVGLIDGSFEIGNFYFYFGYCLVIRFAELKTAHTGSIPLILPRLDEIGHVPCGMAVDYTTDS